MAEAIEMETLGISEKIDRNNEEIKQIKKTLNRNKKLTTFIVIPMLGVIIIRYGFT